MSVSMSVWGEGRQMERTAALTPTLTLANRIRVWCPGSSVSRSSVSALVDPVSVRLALAPDVWKAATSAGVVREPRRLSRPPHKRLLPRFSFFWVLNIDVATVLVCGLLAPVLPLVCFLTACLLPLTSATGGLPLLAGAGSFLRDEHRSCRVRQD